ncbi:signal peptidase II [Testudinibacter aquarius]|uniref:Lipoprotein signal peptidase n=1 Tax=Testudinibacter aquarius TaxID=1524974 RepID=A0A4R3Y0S6_9PAST|nr:signal peptidase II [Testudinibacter aquarius]KAE9525374.1 signal peptidase II [Testudinibacter aquarius]TCV85266.1 signal peptidase II [Testudinibacter aquarius]TNG92120.1 lipoprotein signal peptidase [Testudinibacter aquarius]
MKKNGLSFLWLSAIAFILDLLSKWIVVNNFQLYESINILPVFNFTYVRNYGAAFSFLADHGGWQKYFFIVLALGISALLIYWLYRNSVSKKLMNCGYALIIGGALANMVDRTYHGFVVDFLHVYWENYHFPVFNIADVSISIGAGLLILDYFVNPEKKNSQSE